MVYAVNTLGSIIGVIIAVHLMLEWVGVRGTLLAGALVVLAASAVFHAAIPRLRRVVLAEHPTVFPPTAS
jgi:hypothetical protein